MTKIANFDLTRSKFGASLAKNISKQKAQILEGYGIKLSVVGDEQGIIYDLCGQTVNCILGQNDPYVQAMIIKRIVSGKPSFLSTQLGQEIYYEIPSILVKVCGMPVNSMVNHRLNNGSDALDLAVNIAIKHYANKKIGKRKVVSFKGSYHGQGDLPYNLSDLQSHLRFNFNDNIVFMEAPSHSEIPTVQYPLTKNDKKNLKDIEKMHHEIACVLIEPIQYNNNVNIINKLFLKRLRAVCDKYKITLIFDEVQTFGGWLGCMTASQLYGVQPDIMCISKALTAGFGPLSVVIAKPCYRNSSAVGSRTNGSDVRSLVATKAVIERMLGIKCNKHHLKKINIELGGELERGLISRVPMLASILTRELSLLKDKYPMLVVRKKGYGLAQGIEIANSNELSAGDMVKKIEKLLIKRGVFVRVPSNQNANVLLFKLPVVAEIRNIKRAFNIIDNVFSLLARGINN